MTPEEYRLSYAEIEARARLRAGHEINRRAGNGGRYWALGAQIAQWQAEPALARIEAEMRAELHVLNEAWFAQEMVSLDELERSAPIG